MNERSSSEFGRSRAIALGALLLAACSNTIEGNAQDGAAAAPSAGNAGSSTAGTPSSGGNSNQGGAGGTSSGTGGTGVTGGTGPIVVNPPPFQPAAGMLRRLTRAQFRNAVRDVFGVEIDASQLDSDIFTAGFAVIGAAAVVTSERGVERYHEAIEGAVNTVFADPARRGEFIGCTPGNGANDACVRSFIQSKGRLAWRRPLDAAEVDRVAAVAATAATELGSAIEGVRWATVQLFTSPNFLYRPELGAAGTGGTLKFTGYEMATRLAFLAWNSVPDAALLDDAERGTLATAAGVREVLGRLLGAAAGREAVGAFAEEFMRLDRVATQAKDPGLYPEYGPGLQAAMARDMRGTWEVNAFDDRASVFDLFSTTKVVVNAELAQLYGLDASGLDTNTFRVMSLPADGPRAGILSKAGFLSQFANQKEGSPTLRGKFMSESLLCTPVSPPPGDVDIVLEDPPMDQPMTKRQRLEVHRTEDACAGCHSLMDPLGLPLESFDAIGRYRTTDHGLSIDPSGEFDGVAVADARELGVAVGASPTVAQCLTRKYYSYAVGHVERAEDGSVLNDLGASFQASGFRLRDLVIDIAAHDAFSSVAPQP